MSIHNLQITWIDLFMKIRKQTVIINYDQIYAIRELYQDKQEFIFVVSFYDHKLILKQFNNTISFFEKEIYSAMSSLPLQNINKLSNRYSLSSQRQKHLQKVLLPPTVRQTFPHRFSQELWDQITVLSAKEFLKQQNQIRDELFQNKKLFQSYFPRFYQNHNHIYHWSILARQKFADIRAYIFEDLIKKPLESHIQYFESLQTNKKARTFYMPSVSKSAKKKQSNKENKGQKILKNASSYESKARKINNITLNNYYNDQKSYKCDENSKREILKSIFNKVLSEDQKNKFDKYSIYLSNRGQNYHQLFVKTYMACDGPKFIIYDYERHMKGFRQRSNYNEFIRAKKISTLHQSPSKSRTSKQFNKQGWPTVQEPKNLQQQSQKSMNQGKINSSFQYISFGNTNKKILKKIRSKQNKSLEKLTKGLQRIIHPKTFKINMYPFALRKAQIKNRF